MNNSSVNKGRLPETPTMITDVAHLTRFCERASRAPYVIIDTEFMRETTYWPILCLVQVAIGGEPDGGEDEDDLSAVIDPLANGGLDLNPLYEIMANENILKVFHAARQDLEIFYKGMGRLPHPVFDTQVAAMVCGFGDSVGYENLLSRLTGAAVDKGARFTDWSIRPLSKRQIDYALADVVFLKPAYLQLCALLEESGRSEWIGEEMSTLLDEEIYDVDPLKTYKRIKARNAKPRTLAVLRELAAWRETEARRRNVPRNRVIRDEAILEISHSMPKDSASLAKTRGLGQKLADGSAGQAILAAVKKGISVPDNECPDILSKQILPRGIGPTAELIKVLLKIKCEEFDVAQKLIASSDDIDQIAAFGEKAPVRAMKNWRFDVFGQDALRIKNGECAIGMKNNKLILVDI